MVETNNRSGLFIIQLMSEVNPPMTEEQVANEVGVSQQAVCKWLKGGGIKEDNQYKLAELFGVSPAEIFAGRRFDVENQAEQRIMETMRVKYNAIRCICTMMLGAAMTINATLLMCGTVMLVDASALPNYSRIVWTSILLFTSICGIFLLVKGNQKLQHKTKEKNES